MVKGYSQWQKEIDRHVKSGEKGIKIFAPAPYKVKKLVDKIDPDTRSPYLTARERRLRKKRKLPFPPLRL